MGEYKGACKRGAKHERVSTGAAVLTIADLLADVLREVLVLKRRAMQNVLEVGLVLGAAVKHEPGGVNATL